MNFTNFKKITYILAIITIVFTAYLGLIRKLANGDSATSRNAKFIGIKYISVQSNISNRKDLNIDGDKSTGSTTTTQNTSIASTSTGSKNGFYTVKEGDTYGCISEDYYGSYEHWPEILSANIKYGNGFSEHQLHVGAVLEMPVISTENLKPKSNLCS